MPKYGAACDKLILAQLVTVDGRQVEASRGQSELPSGSFLVDSRRRRKFRRGRTTVHNEFPPSEGLRAAVLLRLGRRGR